MNFRGEERSNATHRSATDPDCRFVSKGSSGTEAYPGYTVNAVMKNPSASCSASASKSSQA